MSVGRFYGMIGALLRRRGDGRYLVLRRSGAKDFGAGTWECVTGRVDQGERFSDAVRREVIEELGLSAHIDFIIGTVHLYRGDEVPENEMLGVQYCCSVDQPGALRTSWEHTDHRWVSAAEAAEFLPDEHWLLQVIRHADRIRSLLPEELVVYTQVNDLL